jgi:hypothetical protein
MWLQCIGQHTKTWLGIKSSGATTNYSLPNGSSMVYQWYGLAICRVEAVAGTGECVPWCVSGQGFWDGSPRGEASGEKPQGKSPRAATRCHLWRRSNMTLTWRSLQTGYSGICRILMNLLSFSRDSSPQFNRAWCSVQVVVFSLSHGSKF